MLNTIRETTDEVPGAFAFFAGADKFFLEAPAGLNASGEKARLEKDLEYQRGFLESVMKKLGNEKFVAKAKPEVIETEKKKAEEAEEKIRSLEGRLQAM
jgi:valyl-tRNA synthetase